MYDRNDWNRLLQATVGPGGIESLPVAGHSMTPTLPPGCSLSLAPLTLPLPLGALLLTAQADALVVHRLVRTVHTRERQLFITQGDNRQQPDPPVTAQQIVAVVRAGWLDGRKIWPGPTEPLLRWRWVARYAGLRIRQRIGQRLARVHSPAQ